MTCRRRTSPRPRTRSSNTVPSSGESTNHRFLGGGAASAVWHEPGLLYARAAANDATCGERAEASVTGAKGVGEGGTNGAPAAVLNAVSDALAPFGIGIFEMPITPQRISQLLREARFKAQ